MRLNLLPPPQRRYGPARHTVAILLLTSLTVITVLVYSGVYLSVATARHQLAQVESQLALLQPAEENMRQVQDLWQRRNRKQAILAALTGQNRSCYDTLLRIGGQTPDTVWFKAVTQDGTTVQVQGWARNYQDLADFAHRLEAEGSFSVVAVVEAKDDGNLPLTDFTLRLSFK